MADHPNHRRPAPPSPFNPRGRAATEPYIPALTGEIQPVLALPVDSLTLLDATNFNTALIAPPNPIGNPPGPFNRPPRESLHNQIRTQLRQVLGLGQPHNHADNLQNMNNNLRPGPANAAAYQQTLVQALNLSTPLAGADERTRVLVRHAVEQAQQGNHDPQNIQGATGLFSNWDIHIRTPLLQALNLSQQELSQNQARLQAFRAAVEESLLQQTNSANSQPSNSNISNPRVSPPQLTGNFARPSFNLPLDGALLGSQLATTREDFVFLADCSFRAHRHEELLAHVRRFLTVLGLRRDLLKDERYLIAVGYKDSIRGVRDAWRKIRKMEVDEKDAFKLLVSSKYRSDLEDKMKSVCAEGLRVSSGLLNDSVTSMETRLYFFKVKGDLYRYTAEYSTGTDKTQAASLGRSSYEEADRIKSCVSAVHPLRLGLALNFGVFLRDACHDSNRGWRVTKVALDDANRGFQMLAELDSNDYRESNGLLMNLRRNLMRWNTADIEVNGQNTATAVARVPANQLYIRN